MRMRRVGPLPMVAVFAMVAATLVGTPAPAQAETYLIEDRAAFDAALPHLAVDDFETATIEGLIEGCGPLLSRDHPTGCFDNNGLQPGIVYLTDTYPDPEGGGIAAEPGTNHGVLSQMILGSGEIILGFTEPVDTVGLDLGVEYFATFCSVTVYYVDGGAPDEFPIECRESPPAPRFLGFTSDRLIRGIRIDPTGREASPFIDNVRFGLRAPNDFAVSSVRKNRTSGSATLVVRTPAAGVTSVKGDGVVAGEARSRGDEVVRLTVTPTGATKRKLNQTGKATVTLWITFSPAGGVPKTVKRTVTLVKARR